LQTKHLLMVAIALEGLGGLLFTLGSTVGAYLLVRINSPHHRKMELCTQGWIFCL
jgi:hypothetical protein